jgi:hypothetical protein
MTDTIPQHGLRCPELSFGVPARALNTTHWKCSHCETSQETNAALVDTGPMLLAVYRCVRCSRPTLQATVIRAHESNTYLGCLYPVIVGRPPQRFAGLPAEVLRSYEEACRLMGFSAGASGAYARRTLELTLDHLGYVGQSLADGIKAAEAEKDVDKRLPKRVLQQLGYIREIGNFALHVRRDDALILVEIDDVEAAACLDIIEEMLREVYSIPVGDYDRILALNEKLMATGKKALPLPDLPPGAIVTAGSDEGA